MALHCVYGIALTKSLRWRRGSVVVFLHVALKSTIWFEILITHSALCITLHWLEASDGSEPCGAALIVLLCCFVMWLLKVLLDLKSWSHTVHCSVQMEAALWCCALMYPVQLGLKSWSHTVHGWKRPCGAALIPLSLSLGGSTTLHTWPLLPWHMISYFSRKGAQFSTERDLKGTKLAGSSPPYGLFKPFDIVLLTWAKRCKKGPI